MFCDLRVPLLIKLIFKKLTLAVLRVSLLFMCKCSKTDWRSACNKYLSFIYCSRDIYESAVYYRSFWCRSCVFWHRLCLRPYERSEPYNDCKCRRIHLLLIVMQLTEGNATNKQHLPLTLRYDCQIEFPLRWPCKRETSRKKSQIKLTYETKHLPLYEYLGRYLLMGMHDELHGNSYTYTPKSPETNEVE